MTERRKELLTGLVVGALVTFFVNLPLWYAIAFQGELTWPDITQESSDEAFYLTRIQEIVDHHPAVGNPYIFERRGQQYPLGTLAERMLSLPMTMFGWNLKTASILGDLFLPLVCALLTWLAFGSLLQDKRWRALAVGIVFLGTHVTLWKRPVSPQAITILPLIWLWLFLSPSRHTRTSLFGRSALIGFMTMSYPFHWTYCIAVEGIAWIMSRIEERGITKKSLFDALCLVLPFVVLASPWILGALTMSHDPDYKETLTRLGLLDRRLPVGPFLQLKILACFALVIIGTWKQKSVARLPITALLLTGIGMLWLPLFTGKEAEFANHYEKILMFPLSLAVVFGIMKLTETSKMGRIAAASLLTLVLVLSTVSTTLRDASAFSNARLSTPERTAIQEEMDDLKKLEPERIILTENSNVPNITMYTSHYPFAFYDAYMYLASDAELVDRAVLYNTLVPDEPIPERGIFGTRYLNNALYGQTVCRLQAIFGKSCAPKELPCPFCEMVRHPPVLTEKQIVQKLVDAHVTYVFLKKLPPVLHPYVQTISTTDDRTLYAFLPR